MTMELVRPDRVEHCTLQSTLFSSFGEVRFRRSETDGKPMMTMILGEREAQLPILSLRRELGIDDESPDGRMLDLISAALDFVPCVAPGDRLPAEVLTGEASWRPSNKHLRLATTRMSLNLIDWLSPNGDWADAKRDEIMLLRMADNPALRTEVVSLAASAAQRLDLQDGPTVLRLMDALALELAYIEALRQRLLARVEALCRRVARILLTRRSTMTIASDTLAQVYRLALLAYRSVRAQFDNLDAQTGEFSSLMRNPDCQRQFIRSNRDGLYRIQRSWDKLLNEWDQVEEDAEEIPAMLAKTYHFLAPRFMPVQHWRSLAQAGARKGQVNRRQMAW